MIGSVRRASPQGILCVLHQDIAWQLLPLDRQLRAGVFERSHRILLAEPSAAAGELDWTRARGRRPRAREKRGEP